MNDVNWSSYSALKVPIGRIHFSFPPYPLILDTPCNPFEIKSNVRRCDSSGGWRIIPQILGFKQAGMKNRRKINAEIQVYRAKVIAGMLPAASTTFSWIFEKIVLNSGGQDAADMRIRFHTCRVCVSNRFQFSSKSSPGFMCAGSTYY